LTGVFWAVALITIGGLGILMGTVVTLAALGVRDEEVFVPVSMGGFLTVLAVAWMLIRQMSRVIDASAGEVAAGKKQASALSRRAQAQITGPPPSVPSVTENTTRSFENARRQQSAVDDRWSED
jgi:hypothetical protein